MRPKQLKTPYTWQERKPLLEQGIFHVPEYYFEHHAFDFPKWSESEVFGSDQPLHIEFCTGNGDWIAEKAKKYPYINWIAVEIRFDRVQKIWSKKQNHNLTNLFIVHGDANTFVKHYMKDSQLDQVYINFPDPWPKQKHAKNRLLQPSFMNEVVRIMKNRGLFTFVTDDPQYAESTYEMLNCIDQLKSLYPSPYYIEFLQDYGTSYFDQLWRERGKVIRYAQFRVNK